MNNERIKLIRRCGWEEVFLEWYKSEGEKPDWIDLARRRGFASWAEWRLKGYAERFELAKVEWGLYEIYEPGEVVSDWFGGPFRTWIERHYGGEKTRTFGQLATQSDVYNHIGIKSMMENYPKNSVITALELPDGRIFVIEGSHRSCALALAAQQGKPFPGKLIFAIGKSNLSELPPVGENG